MQQLRDAITTGCIGPAAFNAGLLCKPVNSEFSVIALNHWIALFDSVDPALFEDLQACMGLAFHVWKSMQGLMSSEFSTLLAKLPVCDDANWKEMVLTHARAKNEDLEVLKFEADSIVEFATKLAEVCGDDDAHLLRHVLLSNRELALKVVYKRSHFAALNITPSEAREIAVAELNECEDVTEVTSWRRLDALLRHAGLFGETATVTNMRDLMQLGMVEHRIFDGIFRRHCDGSLYFENHCSFLDPASVDHNIYMVNRLMISDEMVKCGWPNDRLVTYMEHVARIEPVQKAVALLAMHKLPLTKIMTAVKHLESTPQTAFFFGCYIVAVDPALLVHNDFSDMPDSVALDFVKPFIAQNKASLQTAIVHAVNNHQMHSRKQLRWLLQHVIGRIPLVNAWSELSPACRIACVQRSGLLNGLPKGYFDKVKDNEEFMKRMHQFLGLPDLEASDRGFAVHLLSQYFNPKVKQGRDYYDWPANMCATLLKDVSLVELLPLFLQHRSEEANAVKFNTLLACSRSMQQLLAAHDLLTHDPDKHDHAACEALQKMPETLQPLAAEALLSITTMYIPTKHLLWAKWVLLCHHHTNDELQVRMILDVLKKLDASDLTDKDFVGACRLSKKNAKFTRVLQLMCAMLSEH